MGVVVRVLLGLILANIAAGLTIALFVHTPEELIAGLSEPASAADPWSQLGASWLVATVQGGIFSSLFGLIAALIGEWWRIREWTYYAIAGVVIALLGFSAQWLTESTGQNWSVVDSNYPFVAFLTTGFVGGFVYWMWAGRLAGGGTHNQAASVSANKA